MLREEHVVDELHAFRYRGDAPRYAIVISHGIGAHGGIYDVFCCHHAARGVDIWSYSAPGHGQSTTNRPRGQWTLAEWVEGSRLMAAHVKALTGLPVFTLGSSLGVAAAIAAIDSPDVSGAICMGSPAVPGSVPLMSMGKAWCGEDARAILKQLGRAARVDINLLFNFDEDYGYPGAGEQKHMDPWNTWTYDLASWASLFQYELAHPLSANTKPVLYTAGEKDPSFQPEVIRLAASAIGGPVTVKIFDGASHQLMLFHTREFSDAVHDFCTANI